MPLHDDEMNRRREKREVQRKKQEAEARRMKRMLVLAAVVLVLCGIGIYKLSRNTENYGQREEEAAAPTTQQTEPPTEATRETSPAEKSTITTIHIKAAGDLNVTDSVIDAGQSANGYDYSRAFKDVASILADADLTVMNFEGNACGEPYGTATTSAPVELLQGLRDCGVDLLQTANSCVINNGLIGLTSTLNSIRSVGLEPLGSYATLSERQASKGYTIADVKGVKVAFVAFTKGVGGMGMPAGNEELVNLLYTDYSSTYKQIDRDGITKLLKTVAEEKPDITIALLHWGSEYNDDISGTQESIVSLMKKQGVDVIIGTHPHTVQSIVFDELQGTLVAYSLGDFFGDAARGGTNYSIILDIEITKDSSSGTTKVTDFTYDPIYTLTEAECVDGKRRVVRIGKTLEAYAGNYLDKISQTTAESMQHALVRIEERVAMTVEVICPKCDKKVEVLVNSKTGELVKDATCQCKNVLPAGSDVSRYD